MAEDKSLGDKLKDAADGKKKQGDESIEKVDPTQPHPQSGGGGKGNPPTPPAPPPPPGG